jgi:hypothetical protein
MKAVVEPTIAGHASPLYQTAQTGNDLVARILYARRVVLSHGELTVEPIANLIRLPAGHEEHVIDYHAVARDSCGRIYVLYNSLQRFPHTRALARFHYLYDEQNGEGRFVFDTFLGTRAWAEGTVHGLSISREVRPDGSAGEEQLLIVNNDGTIILADLDGNVRWQLSLNDDGPLKPTAAVAATRSASFGVVDGYGNNANFVYSSWSGEIVAVTGAKGSGDGQSSTNHGVDVDPDGNFVVADRGNTRLTWWTADTFEPIVTRGLQRRLDMPELQVCGVSFLENRAVVACLNSKLAFLAPDEHGAAGYKVVAVFELPEALIAAGIDGVHDAEFTPDGRYVVVAVWERRRAERQIPTLTAFKLNW